MIDLPVAPVRGVDFGGGCGSETCPCYRPWRLCEEWMGRSDAPESAFCPRCGWARLYHPEAAASSSSASVPPRTEAG